MKGESHFFTRLLGGGPQHSRGEIKILPFEVYDVLESEPGEIGKENESLPRIASGI